MTKKFVVFLLALVFLFTPIFINADEVSDLSQKIAEYTEKLNQLGTAKNTLANQIKILDSQIELTLLKITQTENSIKTLEKEIGGLTVEIDKLDGQLDSLSVIFINQIVQNYKLQKRVPAFAYIFGSNLNDFLERHKYITTLQKESQNNLIDMETIRTNYDLQKTEKEKKQTELEELQKTLATQKTSLNSQKASKNKLLNDTKNDEKKYQQLLTQAQSQLAALKNFSKTYGNTCLDSTPGGGSDGNFYSQRDPRWCHQAIGYSSDTIGEVGCYISSVSMTYKKLGYDITPSAYAANPSNFWANTAYMNNPTPPPGYTYKQVSYSTSVIDNELGAGRYVIAQMRMSTVAGMHFIVITSGSNGNYKIHDPWFGADQNFSDRYSPSLVMSLRLITK